MVIQFQESYAHNVLILTYYIVMYSRRIHRKYILKRAKIDPFHRSLFMYPNCTLMKIQNISLNTSRKEQLWSISVHVYRSCAYSIAGKMAHISLWWRSRPCANTCCYKHHKPTCTYINKIFTSTCYAYRVIKPSLLPFLSC
jgi:hypothetical protein